MFHAGLSIKIIALQGGKTVMRLRSLDTLVSTPPMTTRIATAMMTMMMTMTMTMLLLMVLVVVVRKSSVPFLLPRRDCVLLYCSTTNLVPVSCSVSTAGTGKMTCCVWNRSRKSKSQEHRGALWRFHHGFHDSLSKQYMRYINDHQR